MDGVVPAGEGVLWSGGGVFPRVRACLDLCVGGSDGVVVCYLGTRLELYSCASVFLKIQNPKSTNLARSLGRAPIHNTVSKTKTLLRDQSILQRSFTQLAFDASLVFTDRSAIATATCDLRARCAAAVRSHYTKNPVQRSKYLTALIHTVGIRCFFSIHRLQCDCDCDLRLARSLRCCCSKP